MNKKYNFCPYCKNEFDPNYLINHIILYCDKKDKKTTLIHKKIILKNIRLKCPNYSEKNINKTNLQLAKKWIETNKRFNLTTELKKKNPNNSLCFISDKQIKLLDKPNFLEFNKNFSKFMDPDIKLNLYTHLYIIILKGKKKYTTLNKPNKDLILQINTPEDENICIKRYELNKDNPFNKIKKYYAGIEFNLNGNLMNKDYGCIWNMNIIKDLKLIAKQRKGYPKGWNIL